uniref:Uncharacterized protein n=1 Tax=Onchocerca volvulus TaxID=6282 RepID=A0A8R1TV04_ONCVO
MKAGNAKWSSQSVLRIVGEIHDILLASPANLHVGNREIARDLKLLKILLAGRISVMMIAASLTSHACSGAMGI